MRYDVVQANKLGETVFQIYDRKASLVVAVCLDYDEAEHIARLLNLQDKTVEAIFSLGDD